MEGGLLSRCPRPGEGWTCMEMLRSLDSLLCLSESQSKCSAGPGGFALEASQACTSQQWDTTVSSPAPPACRLWENGDFPLALAAAQQEEKLNLLEN